MLNETKTTHNKHKNIASLSWCKPMMLLAAGTMAIGALNFVPTGQTSIAHAETKNGTFAHPLGRAPLSFADLAEKVKPAVVSIQIKDKLRRDGGARGRTAPGQRPRFRGIPGLPEDHPFNELFRRYEQERGRGGQGGRSGPREILRAQGSGFIISEDGYVVTNNHVVDKGDEISIKMENGEEYKAKMIGGDSRTDIALLKIDSKGTKFPTVKFAEKQARVGDWVLAVGNPFGFGGTVTAGIVSAKNRDISSVGSSSAYDYLQIDAAINKGNSGGPSFNLNGEVIGVNTSIVSPSGGNVGIAFAVPAALTKDVIEQLKKNGSVNRGWLGVVIQPVTQDLADTLGMKKPYGAMVTELTKGGPASKTDIKVRDVIVKVNDQKVKDTRDLIRKITSLPPKKDAKITVFRDGKEKEITVKLGLFPGAKKLARLIQGEGAGEEIENLGLTLDWAPKGPNSDGKGVIISDIDPESEASEKGLKQGDEILEVRGEKIQSPDDVFDIINEAVKAGRKKVDLLVRSNKRRRFVVLSLKSDSSNDQN